MVQKLELNPVTGQLDLVGLDEVKWGEIQGDINDQTDLISLIPTELPTTSDLQAVTINGNTTNIGIVATALNKQNTFNGDGVTVFNTGSNETAGLRQDRLFFDFGVGQISVYPNTSTVSPITLNLPPISGTIALLSDIIAATTLQTVTDNNNTTTNEIVILNGLSQAVARLRNNSNNGEIAVNNAANTKIGTLTSSELAFYDTVANIQVKPPVLTAGRLQTLQDADGTIALLSDITATAIGLDNVDNTSDIDKPVSTATQSALDLKADKTILINGNDLTVDVSLGLQSILDVDSYATSDINIVGNDFNVVDGSNVVIASLSGNTGSGELLVKAGGSNTSMRLTNNTIFLNNNNGFRIELRYTPPTTNRIQNFQNASGVIALLNDCTKPLFTQTATVTTTNVITETDLLSAYSIPASTMLVGSTIRVLFSGLYSRGGGNSTFRVYLGTTLVAYTVSQNAANNTNASMSGYVDITFRAIGVTGNVMVGGNINLESTVYGLRNAQVSGVSSLLPTTINTVISQQIRITHQFSGANAANTLSTLTASIISIKA